MEKKKKNPQNPYPKREREKPKDKSTLAATGSYFPYLLSGKIFVLPSIATAAAELNWDVLKLRRLKKKKNSET